MDQMQRLIILASQLLGASLFTILSIFKMGENNESKIEFLALRFSTLFFIVIAGIFVILGIFQLRNLISNTNQMMYWVVCIGSFFTFFAVFLFWKTKIRGNIEFQNEVFIIQLQQKNQLDIFPYEEITNYNIYKLPIKKWV